MAQTNYAITKRNYRLIARQLESLKSQIDDAEIQVQELQKKAEKFETAFDLVNGTPTDAGNDKLKIYTIISTIKNNLTDIPFVSASGDTVSFTWDDAPGTNKAEINVSISKVIISKNKDGSTYKIDFILDGDHNYTITVTNDQTTKGIFGGSVNSLSISSQIFEAVDSPVKYGDITKYKQLTGDYLATSSSVFAKTSGNEVVDFGPFYVGADGKQTKTYNTIKLVGSAAFDTEPSANIKPSIAYSKQENVLDLVFAPIPSKVETA